MDKIPDEIIIHEIIKYMDYKEFIRFRNTSIKFMNLSKLSKPSFCKTIKPNQNIIKLENWKYHISIDNLEDLIKIDDFFIERTIFLEFRYSISNNKINSNILFDKIKKLKNIRNIKMTFIEKDNNIETCRKLLNHVTKIKVLDIDLYTLSKIYPEIDSLENLCLNYIYLDLFNNLKKYLKKIKNLKKIVLFLLMEDMDLDFNKKNFKFEFLNNYFEEINIFVFPSSLENEDIKNNILKQCKTFKKYLINGKTNLN